MEIIRSMKGNLRNKYLEIHRTNRGQFGIASISGTNATRRFLCIIIYPPDIRLGSDDVIKLNLSIQ